jgi:hypothetical protein
MGRISNSKRACIKALGPTLLLLMSACDHGSATPSLPTGAAAPSYVLVTQNRPESLDNYLAFHRARYGTCVVAANLRHEVVKPFPAVPRDFVDIRTTYASDGRRVVKREVLYGLDFVDDEKLTGCEMRVSSVWSVHLLSGGQQQFSESDAHGKVTVGEPEPNRPEPARASSSALYTIPRTTNGVRLQCSADNQCIVDPAVIAVVEEGSPVRAAARIEGLPTYGTAAVLEPVSLVVGKSVDPALFELEPHK